MSSVADDRETRALRALTRGLLALPGPALRALAGPPVTSDEGATLDPRAQLLARVQRLARRPPYSAGTPAAARAELDRGIAVVDGPPDPGVQVREVRVPAPGGERPARVYRAAGAPDGLPLLVFFHGGGFVLGSLESYQALCTVIAREGACVVLSVDYRLAPEHPFPASGDDALAAFRWARREARALRADPARVAVGGDSAGGYLAAVTALRARDAGEPGPHAQWLAYPLTDATRGQPSHRLFDRGYMLDGANLDWFMSHWLAGHDPADPRASPLLAASHAGLPPAHVVVAGFDVLRDEGAAYAARLAAAGGKVTLQRAASLPHGFLSMTGALPAARAARDEALAGLRALW